MPDRGGERMHQDAGARWLRRRRAVRAARIAAQLALLLLAACLLLPRGGTRQEAAEAFARTPEYSMFGGWIYAIIFVVAYYPLSARISGELYLVGISAFTGLLCLALDAWLKKKGTKIFAEL